MVLRLAAEQFIGISSTSRLSNIGYLGEEVGGRFDIAIKKKNLKKKSRFQYGYPVVF